MNAVALRRHLAARGIQLRVEGNQLRVDARGASMTAADSAAIAVERDALIALLRREAAACVAEAPLSHNQRSLWFVAQEAPDSAAYNLAIASRIRLVLNPATFRVALQGLTDRHAMLRTTYHLVADGPVQRTAGYVQVAFTEHDVTDADDSLLQELVEAEYRRPFDLAGGPVFRAALFSRAADDHVFLMVVHHIAADGWSLGILSEDFRALQAEAEGLAITVAPPAAVEYSDFVAWQQRLLESADGERLGDFWEERLRQLPAALELPGDRPRPPRKSFRGGTVPLAISDDLLNGLRDVAREHSTTLFVLLLAALDAMVFRLSGHDEPVIGTPTLGRTTPEFAGVVGYFVNPVPLRTRLQAGMPFRVLLGRVRSTVVEALEAQDYPLPLIVQRARAVRDASRSPLFEVFFASISIERVPGSAAAPSEVQPSGLQGEPYRFRLMEGQFDLSLNATEWQSSLQIEFRYSSDLFDEATVRGFSEHYQQLLQAVVANVDSPIEALQPPPAAAPAPIDAFLATLAARDIRVVLDGDKLKLNAPAGALTDDLKRELSARKTEILASLRGALPATIPLRPVARTGTLPISFAQQRLWFFDQMQPGTAHYNISLPLQLRGRLHREALARTLDALIHRHEALRTCIRAQDGQPRATIRDYPDTAVEFRDLSALPDDEREVAVDDLLRERALEPFDLSRGPLARFLLVKLSDDEHRLLLSMHHIASDGWSLSVAAREICAVYDADVAGGRASLPELRIQYVDYAAWQRELLTSGQLVRQLDFWRRELDGAPAVLELPTDRPRPAVQSYRGTRRSQRLSTAQLEALKAFSRGHGVTLYMTMLAAWQVLLARHSGQDDIVVGSPLANRDQPEFEALIGCFVNNVVMRCRLDGNPPFVDLLARVKSNVLAAFDHRDLPFDRVVEAVHPERNASRHPIFQTLFTLHSFPISAMQPAGLQVEVIDNGEGPASSRFDLTLEMDEVPDGLRMVYEYVVDLFDRTTIERLHQQYVTLLEAVVADATRPIRDLPLLTSEAERTLLQQVNATAVDHDRSATVHGLVSAVAARTPEAIAVEAEDATLTYRDLDRRANRLALVLQEHGVGPGDLVGVCLDRTSTLPLALLAVLKAGAAYVPIDPGHPPDRLAYTLLDAKVRCVVTETRFRQSVAAAHVPLVLLDVEAIGSADGIDRPPDVPTRPDDLAYVIYTSGSTGRPKGVELEHRHFVNLLRGMAREPGIAATDVLLAVTTPSFDIAGLELFLPLVTGARTVIASRAEVLDGERLGARITESGATILQATPATWRLLLDAGWAGKRDLVALCGGEALPRDLARDLSTRVRALWNMYGPTETTIWSTVHQVTAWGRDISIGHPIMNTTVYVLDPEGRQVPPGVAGELCIGGEGVARGYRERPELTAEKFVTVMLSDRGPERVYRTGDVVRLRSDLTLEFVGRRDQQVKVRGYRIELGEIETVLGEHPSVRRAVVVVREETPGDQRLVAYVVAAAGPIPDDELRTLLRSRLPEYMVPSAIVTLDALPLTPNGKLDRKALPAPRLSAAAAAAADAVMTPTQRRVAAVWSRVLQRERVGLHDNFFDLGGHSLLVVKVHAALREEFNAPITVIDLFQRTTVAGQAELVASTEEQTGGLERAHARLARQAAV